MSYVIFMAVNVRCSGNILVEWNLDAAKDRCQVGGSQGPPVAATLRSVLVSKIFKCSSGQSKRLSSSPS